MTDTLLFLAGVAGIFFLLAFVGTFLAIGWEAFMIFLERRRND